MPELGPTYTAQAIDDDATENVKPHLQLHVFCGVVAFAASRKYVTVKV